MQHQLFADYSQLHRSSQPSDIDQTVLSVQDCISDIKEWITDKKFQQNEDKTEAMLFNSPKLQAAPASLSVCQTTVTFSDPVRNSVHETAYHPRCEIAFFELRRISTIRQYLTADATNAVVVSLLLSRIDYCNSLLAGLSLSLISKLQRVQNYYC